MPHKKKVNQLSLKECEEILFKLANNEGSKYYRHILERVAQLQKNKTGKNTEHKHN